MTPSRAPSTCLLRSLCTFGIGDFPRSTATAFRTFATAERRHEAQVELATPLPSYYSNPNPATVLVPKLEKRLLRAGTPPIASRRRRAAIAQTSNVPFNDLPYQCFQEARKVLMDDREEKLKKIENERARIAKLREADPELSGGERRKQKRLQSMQMTLEKLKILADINDPNVKRRFEDGMGDMNKPIYRYLAERKWKEYRRKIQVQRIDQFRLVPDVIPYVDPVVDIRLAFGRRKVQPGDFVESITSEQPPRMDVQPFTRGEKLLTIAVVDPDVPNLQTDAFDYRCHFLASNVPITPTSTSIDLAKLSPETQIMLPWHPAYSQKGLPYQRMCVVVLQQKDNILVDLGVATKKAQQDNFVLKGFATRHMLTPIGATLFRTKWDEGTAGVMTRAGIEGADVEYKRKKVEPLPYKRRNPSTFR